MSDGVIVEIVKTVATVATAIIAGVVSVRLSRMHKQINSRMDELLASTRREGKAEGIAEQKKDQAEKATTK